MLKRIPVKKLDGSEQFKNTGDRHFSVLEFWRYGFSNLNSNILRGALAEFIIENALKDKARIDVRNPWGDYDIITDDGKKIEVKCCSYIQDWDQKALSRVVWTGLKAKNLYWSSAVTASRSTAPEDYKADIYVLALLKHQDPASLDILDLDQWCFWVISRDKLREISGDRNSVSLIRIEKFKILPMHFSRLKRAIEYP